jgi:hypothetical protein
MARITWNTQPNGGWKSEVVYAHEAEWLAADLHAAGCRVSIEIIEGA